MKSKPMSSDIKILVVDDREDNLFSIQSILEKDGYTIVKANSGRAALKVLLNDFDFTLILMDVQMPGMNGIETASLIYEREKLKHIPIIFITANNYDEEFIFRGYQTGGVDYIYKPINPELLRVKVGVFVELYRKTHQLLHHEKKLLAANKKLESEIEERRISEEKIKLLNQQLVEKNAHLKSTIEDLDRFAYVASHDLQEPLRKIIFFSDRIAHKYKDKIDEQLNSDLEKITRSSRRMNLLINDLLQFSRHSVDEKDFTQVELTNLIREVLTDIEIKIENAKAKIELADLPQVWGVPSQLRQLFQNLISNAIKFRKQDNTPVVQIYSEQVNEIQYNSSGEPVEGKYHKIYICDNGVGFDQKYAEEIFVVFKRLHSYHDFQGTGVGLSICKKIIENHNGFIQAQSKVNEGSTFVICLPVKSEKNLTEAVNEPAKMEK